MASMAGQLATKDEQIARRDAQIDRLHALLAQAQQNASAAIEAASRPVAAVGPAGPIEPAARIGTRPAGRIARAWAVLVGRA